ncbi:hypothetical protein BDN71DRAFT_1432977 [Pleurotus eryngii]|uniref:Uncharacterized protein n=1 Tax=Pleurotus eryngii TaxID=5323 RepID=A0A9P5ZVV3_PLEER|nr:hypothetical protein BDN71DRAFT_1432977 [Pleurotus eryngii]
MYTITMMRSGSVSFRPHCTPFYAMFPSESAELAAKPGEDSSRRPKKGSYNISRKRPQCWLEAARLPPSLLSYLDLQLVEITYFDFNPSKASTRDLKVPERLAVGRRIIPTMYFLHSVSNTILDLRFRTGESSTGHTPTLKLCCRQTDQYLDPHILSGNVV